MDIVFEKMIMILLLAVWFWLFCSMYREWWKKNSANTAIAEADAREKLKWRYVIWGWRMFQLLCQLYLATLILRFVLS